MIDYQLGKIYTLVNTINNTVYVGSTTRKNLSSRMGQHRGSANNLTLNSSIYTAMRALGIQNFRIVLHHNFPCNSKDELEAEEYRVLTQVIVTGTPHYNQRINRKMKTTEASKQKMSATMLAKDMVGEKNKLFTYGGICYRPKWNSWRFQWNENGKRRSKDFAIGIHGNYGAHFRAEEFRKTIYPAYGTKEDVWCDDLGHIEW